ncbi:MAG: AMP-binding protein [Actinobacteria bacterium]|nr:AMP-binding protein [Actinomycetota bacterium]
MRGIPVLEQTLPSLLERQAAAYGEKPLLRCDGQELSFAEVRDRAKAAAATLQAAGIETGDRVLLLSENRIELLEVVLGCAWIGAVVVPVNTALRGDQLQHVVANSQPKLIAVEPALLEPLEKVEAPDALERVWLFAEEAPDTALGAACEPFPELRGEPAPASEEIGPATLVAILYTSGTTGPSKGVCCPQAQFYWWGISVGEMLEIGEDDVLYTCLPMFHTNALNAFVQALVAGATFVIGERFSASRFWKRAAAEGATVSYLLGAMVNILHGRPPAPEDSAHQVRIALAPATPATLHESFRERFGVLLIEGYGSTETNCTIGAAADRQRPGWMGVEIPDYEVDVVDANDVTVAPGEAGELVMRPRHPFSFASGYFANETATVEAWRNLWFHSGDRVLRDEQGWIRFVDRTKDAIRRRGENISSYEVEAAINAHPGVAGVAVFAVPSEMAEDEVMAAVVPKPGVELDPEDLMRHCEGRLAYFAIPRYVDFVEELPMTENGKVRKAVLRERAVTDSTWDREAAGYVLKR